MEFSQFIWWISWAQGIILFGRFHKKNQSLIQLSAYKIHESLTFDETNKGRLNIAMLFILNRVSGFSKTFALVTLLLFIALWTVNDVLGIIIYIPFFVLHSQYFYCQKGNNFINQNKTKQKTIYEPRRLRWSTLYIPKYLYKPQNLKKYTSYY